MKLKAFGFLCLYPWSQTWARTVAMNFVTSASFSLCYLKSHPQNKVIGTTFQVRISIHPGSAWSLLNKVKSFNTCLFLLETIQRVLTLLWVAVDQQTLEDTVGRIKWNIVSYRGKRQEAVFNKGRLYVCVLFSYLVSPGRWTQIQRTCLDNLVSERHWGTCARHDGRTRAASRTTWRNWSSWTTRGRRRRETLWALCWWMISVFLSWAHSSDLWPFSLQSPRRPLQRTFSDESLCSGRRDAGFASSENQTTPSDVLFTCTLPTRKHAGSSNHSNHMQSKKGECLDSPPSDLQRLKQTCCDCVQIINHDSAAPQCRSLHPSSLWPKWETSSPLWGGSTPAWCPSLTQPADSSGPAWSTLLRRTKVRMDISVLNVT